jgi:hypothetical protein
MILEIFDEKYMCELQGDSAKIYTDEGDTWLYWFTYCGGKLTKQNLTSAIIRRNRGMDENN